MKTKIYARKDDVFRSTISFHVLREGSCYLDGKNSHVGQPIKFEAMTENDMMIRIHEPCIRLEIDEAQYLIDQLWDCGLRPSEGTGSAGSMAATQRHLEDMRRLVFKNNIK